MDILVAVGLVVVGLIIGFFVARFIYTQQTESLAAKEAEKNVKAVLTQQAEHHVFQARQTLQGLKHQIDVLEEQISDYEVQTKPSEELDTMPKMTFFGEQATALLRNTHKQRTPKKSTSEEQPRDFANSASGLFIDDNQQPNDHKS
ncbi:DUF1043 family protein [Alteromonas sp. ASW11-36]|uniref:DUF1043 family protein n=1 Tax=Alteromonas arenosi TaxID=3055817 RepID=A0ABT7T082_9ALTE|nr:DUF1043 family protein [Alteromonas sp. ASW11-36]MDM7861847.1 DUF1043 family protein [Alteromonas sp. ASW11-36]